VTIDDEMVFSTANFDDPVDSIVYRQWFQSPTLVDGLHSVTVTNCSNGTIIDYAAIEVGNRTNLTQSTVVVDNESSSISYSGHWTRNTSELISGSLSKGYPYGNSTHRSSTPGDTFTFRFAGALVEFPRNFDEESLIFVAGTSVSVYGVFLWSNVGVLAATYTLDGATISQIHNITSAFVNQEEPNFLHYSMNNLLPGNHTLIGNITTAENQTFILDYITYNPSLEITSTSTSGSINPSTQPSQVQTPSSSTPQSVRTVAILGGVTGVLAILLLAILGRWLFLRGRNVKQSDDPPLSSYEYEPDNSGMLRIT